MSRHWNPNRTRWLSDREFEALTPKARRALYAARGQAKREKAALDSWQVISGGGSATLPPGAKAGLVLVAAACLGIAIGSYQAFGPLDAVAPEAEVEWSPPAPRTIVPEAQADPADADWEGRGSAIASGREAIQQPGVPRRVAARNDGVRASFSYCHTGGGTNCVVDGDTFYVGGAKVRIAGIDAPETHPPRCAHEAQLGRQATEQLGALLNSGAVTMTSIGRDRDPYGRLLRNVQVDGQDVGQALISAGLAREYGSGRRSWC